MKLLLDTHVVLWWLAREPITNAADQAIRNPAVPVLVSAASAWELGIKSALGKLRIPSDFREQLRAQRFTPLSVTLDHGLGVATLPRLHGNPIDRLLIAQARAEDLTLVTRDTRLAEYGVPILAA